MFSPFHRTWLEAPRRDVLGAPRKLPALPRAWPGAGCPRSRPWGSSSWWSEPPRGGEQAGRERLSRFLERRRPRLRGQPRRARSRPHLAALALPAPRMRVRARGGGAAAGRRGSGRVPAPALLARLPPPGAACTSRATRSPSSRSATAAASPGAMRAGASTPGARAAPASRSWTPPCASCAARAGCTTARGSWPDRSSPRTWASTGAGASAGSCACWWTATRPTTTATGSGSPRWAPIRSRRFAGSTTRRARWSATTRRATTCAATCPSCAACPTSTWPSRG